MWLHGRQRGAGMAGGVVDVASDERFLQLLCRRAAPAQLAGQSERAGSRGDVLAVA